MKYSVVKENALLSKPLIVDAPYPTTEGISHDFYSLRIISQQYATSTGELNNVLQYIYHSFNFGYKGYGVYAETLESIAIAEMMHFSLLGKTIMALGAQPVYAQCPPSGFNFYSAKYVAYSQSLKYMLEDDIRAENHAIKCYEKMLKLLKNQKVAEIISRILQDEKIHLAKFEQLLSDFKC